MMLKKKILAILLAVTLLVSLFSGCKAKSDENSDVKKYGATDSRDPLRILVDVSDAVSYSLPLKSFLYELETVLGIKDVMIEFLPSGEDPVTGLMDQGKLAVRSTAMDRLRVEIMAGLGPDLFIMEYHASHSGPTGLDVDSIDALFKYPERAMEVGLFLPLDEYMENHAEYTQWENFTDGVMAAGRNWEGQQIVPISYTLPLLAIPKAEWDYTASKELTWDDMLTNPELLPYSLDLANCRGSYGEGTSVMGWLLPYVMGTLADYEKEELLFTEEELLQRVKEILALERTESYTEISGAKKLSFGSIHRLNKDRYPQPVTLLPLYSVNGGVTAEITQYAAINRSTKKADEAFRVLDYFMSRNAQQNSEIHTRLLNTSSYFPMDEAFYSDEAHWLVNRDTYMTPENHQALCELREQITGANFDGELMAILGDVLPTCAFAEYYGKTVEEIVHEAYENMQRRLRA